MVPRYVDLVDRLPRTPTEKVEKAALRRARRDPDDLGQRGRDPELIGVSGIARRACRPPADGRSWHARRRRGRARPARRGRRPTPSPPPCPRAGAGAQPSPAARHRRRCRRHDGSSVKTCIRFSSCPRRARSTCTAVTGAALLDVGQVALDREVRAARCQISGIDAHEAHERVDAVARQLQVPAVVHVAVVVHPLGRHDPLDHPQRPAVDQLLPADAGSLEQRAFVVVEHRTRPDPDAAQALQHRDQCVVPLRLELPHRSPGGLVIGLRDDAIEQLVRQLGDVDQLGSTATAARGRTEP